MNREQAKAREGKNVKWDWWYSNHPTINSNRGEIHHEQCVDKIWCLIKLTKGGLCMISRDIDDEIFIVSVTPSVLSEFEYPEKSC